MTKPRRATPEDVMAVIRVTEAFTHEECPRCPEDPADRPFSAANKRERRRKANEAE